MQQPKLAIVVSDFNQKITHQLLANALQALPKNNVRVVHVPGAIEIPLAAQWLAKTKKFQAIICLGAVIKGDTSHDKYVCQQVSYGCQRVMLDFNIPVVFGVLTTKNIKQARDRIHLGKEMAATAIKMIRVKKEINAPTLLRKN